MKISTYKNPLCYIASADLEFVRPLYSSIIYVIITKRNNSRIWIKSFLYDHLHVLHNHQNHYNDSRSPDSVVNARFSHQCDLGSFCGMVCGHRVVQESFRP